jgi:hypothetical protein
MFRHGDVLIAPASAIPEDAERIPGVILARGEATGHAHRIRNADDAELFRHGGVLYLRVLTPTHVVHEEHKPIALPIGAYRVWLQREYSPEEIRRVID